jgi:hypothetical protein
MRLTLNHTSDTVTIAQHQYHVATLKQFLINHYPALVTAFMVKAICVNKKTQFTYDWIEIFKRCERTILPLHDFTAIHKPLETVEPAARS